MQRCGRCKVEKAETEFSPTYRGRNGTWCRACFAAHARGESATATHDSRVCERCGRSYTPVQLKAARQFCSRECKDRARQEAERATRLASKVQAERFCIWCALPMPPAKRLDAAFCSEKCTSAARRQLRRLFGRMDGEAPARRAAWLIEQGGKCHLCGLDIPAGAEYPAPDSLTIDHVTPISQGGVTELSNLKPAHLHCNAARGARELT